MAPFQTNQRGSIKKKKKSLNNGSFNRSIHCPNTRVLSALRFDALPAYNYRQMQCGMNSGCIVGCRMSGRVLKMCARKGERKLTTSDLTLVIWVGFIYENQTILDSLKLRETCVFVKHWFLHTYTASLIQHHQAERDRST